MKRPRWIIVAVLVALLSSVALPRALALVVTGADEDVSSVPDAPAEADLTADATEVFGHDVTISPPTTPATHPSISGLTDASVPGSVTASVPSMTCHLSHKAHSHKMPTSKGFKIEWNPIAAVASCSPAVAGLTVQAQLRHNGVTVYSTPKESCSDLSGTPCTSAKTSGSHTCGSSCVGSWYEIGDYYITLPADLFVLEPAPECSYNATTLTYHCVLRSNTLKF